MGRTHTDHPDALPEGYQVQEYEFLSVLGVGGFGITYLARDTLLGRKVAIKEYLPRDFAVRTADHSVRPRSSSESESYTWGLERFLDEARTLASLNHPSIIRIHKYFEAHGSGYIVMEYIEGETLNERLKRQNTLNESQLMASLNPLVQGLEQVHAAGYLHRDITPRNILLRKDSSPVLIDFGSARQELGVRSRSVTSVVTPGYAPLEQYSTHGRQQGPWTDIYGLSAVAYRCITGAVPKDATERAQGEALTPALELGKGSYAEDLLRAIDQGLSIKAEDRPQDLKAWCSLWEQRKKQQSIVAKTKEGSSNAHSGANRGVWKNKKALVAFVIGIVMLLVVVLYIFQVEQVKKEKEAAQKVAEMKAQAERKKAERKAAEERAAAARRAAEMKAQAEKEEAKRKAAEERAAAARRAAEMKAQAEKEEAERKAAEERAAAAGKAAEIKAQAEKEEAKRKAAEERAAAAERAFGQGEFASAIGDYAKAVEWYRQAAKLGYVKAQYTLGMMYEYDEGPGEGGLGVPHSYAEAIKWYRRAAEQGHALAQNNLGMMYKEGHGIPPDYVEAVKWWRRAAEQGHAIAQYNLGQMYLKGRGIPQDYVEAHKWYNLAASRLSSDASDLPKKARDRIAERMTQEEVVTARRLAREWQPKTWDQLKAE